MPKGPKGQKHPVDVISNAVQVMKIATVEVKDALKEDGKSSAAVELGRKGGLARAKNMSRSMRAEIAKRAAASRWSHQRRKAR